MPKRKRETAEKGFSLSPQDKARKYFAFGVKQLTRALKTGKGFEQQKLGRKIKTSRAAGDEAVEQRLTKELSALKGLDWPSTAESILKKTVRKFRPISSNPNCPPEWLEATKAIQDLSTSNVLARLQNTKPVKESINVILEEIAVRLGVELAQASEADSESSDGQGEVVEAVEHIESEEEEVPELVTAPEPASTLETALNLSDGPEALAQASNEDVSESEESASASGISIDGHGSDISLSDDEPMSRPHGSTFLPTLMGGYFSGSESGSDDPRGRKGEAAQPKQKKNRRGQRARQAIWEQKYREQAKHVKNDRNRGWDARKGAVLTGPVRRIPTEVRKPAPMAPKMDNKPLHPSWEAAKKAKESQTKVEFKGKKMVFD